MWEDVFTDSLQTIYHGTIHQQHAEYGMLTHYLNPQLVIVQKADPGGWNKFQ